MENSSEFLSIEQLQSTVNELNKRLEWKKKLLQRNRNCEPRPDENFLRKLDSNLKKNNAFLKKIKTLTESQKDALLKDFGALNLSKFVAELAGILVDLKLKMTDVSCAVELCGLAHQRYADFSPSLIECWKRVLPRPPTKKDPEPPTVTNASKLRVDIRFFSDLVTVGVIPEKEGLQLLGACLSQLINSDKTEHNNLSIITSFCKFCGLDYAGLNSTPLKVAGNKHNLKLPQSDIIAPEKQIIVKNLLTDYYKSAVEHVLSDFKRMKQIELRNRKQYQQKGEVYTNNAQEYERIKTEFDKLSQSVKLLAEQVEEEPPPVPDEGPVDQLVSESGIIVQLDIAARGVDGEGGLWEDEDTRQFYETLPELRQMLPGILFKDSEQATLAPIVEELVVSDVPPSNDAADEVTPTTDDVIVDDKDVPVVPVPVEEDVLDEEANVPVDNDYVEKEDGDEVGDEIEDTVSGDTMKAMIDVFIKDLPNLVNRDLIDKAAVDFVTNLNTKINRKKLVRAIFLVPRTRLDLLPFYARLVAVLKPVMPDVSTEIVQLFLSEFRRHLRKKDQILTESKHKTARMIGELTKFGICPKSEFLHCLKQVLFDFRRHNIEMACSLLDSAGFFLYHSPESHQKTKILLEQMMRKKQAAGAGLDSRYQVLIDNAFYQCCPPPGGTVQKIERPPLHEFIRKLLYKDLSKHQVTPILKSLRKLNWADWELVDYALECLLACWEVRYSCIQYLASLLAGLMYYHNWVGMRVVDALLEDIRLGMEVNDPQFNQRRIACVRYLGEMYNFKVVDSVIIFNTLYSLISFGVSSDISMPSNIDPPDHLFRIRLVCTLLDTCAAYFSSGSSAIKLDCFLTYFLRYYWMKKCCGIWSEERPFPSEVDDILIVTVTKLRPKRDIYDSLDKANEAVKKIEEEYKEKVESALKFVGEEELMEEVEDDERLAPILEDEEEEKTQEERTQSPTQIVSGGVSDIEDLDLEEDEHVVVQKKCGVTSEDNDFCSALDQLMAESLQQRVTDKQGIPQGEITVPPNLKAKMNLKAHFADDDEQEEEPEEEAEELIEERDSAPKVGFMLMVKGKGNKPTLKSIKVSSDSSLAQTWRDRLEVEEVEKQKLKELTLNMTQRMEQEEQIEAEQQIRKTLVVTSKDSQRKFHHQRGAPFPKQIYNNWS